MCIASSLSVSSTRVVHLLSWWTNIGSSLRIEYIWFMLWLTLGIVLSVGLDKCIHHCGLRSSVFFLFFPFSDTKRWQLCLEPFGNLFTVSIVFPFLECRIIDLIQSVTFSHWLLSPSNAHLRFLHVFWWLDNHFFSVLNTISLHKCTTFCLLSHLLNDYFQVLVIVNKVVNIYVQVFMRM